MSKNKVIGIDNKLPWHFSCDLKHFKNLTTGSTIIMGRKTYESIGKPLPNRENFVLTRNSNYEPSGANESLKKFTSFSDAVSSVKTENAYVIGGANLYEQTINDVDGIYLTLINGEYEGDAFYPEVPSDFKIQSREILQEDPKIEVLFYTK